MTNEHETDPAPPPPDPFTAAMEREAKRRAAYEAAVTAARAEMRALLDTCETPALEGVLMRQGHALNSLVCRALDTYAGPALSDQGLAAILKTQRECRQTVQTLTRVREANIRLRRMERDEADEDEKISDERNDIGGPPVWRA